MSRLNNKKKKEKNNILIGLGGVLAVIVLIAAGWIAYNGGNIEKSFEFLGISSKNTQKTIDEKKVPTSADSTNQKADAGNPQSTPNNSDSKDPTPKPKVDSGGYIIGQELPEKPTYVNGVLIASKKYPLPSTFAPGESKEARAAFNEMAAAAKLEGFNLTAFSTYRSYDRQVELYNRYVNQDGKEKADQYSARPGYSEHQTGLAFDIGEVGNEKYFLTEAFGETPAGLWLASHAHEYGFVMRYPKGKEEITGYMYESWHFRYVGKDIAKAIYSKKGTIEEYFNIHQ